MSLDAGAGGESRENPRKLRAALAYSCAYGDVAFLVLLAVIAVLAYRGTTAEDRARYLRMAVDSAREVKTAAQKPRPEYESFREALRVRTRYPFVTVAIVAINAAVFGFMLVGPTPISNPATLVDWGASVGPRTTNGEWWRLVTSTVLHTSMLHVLVNVAVLLQVGFVVERLIGRFTLGAVYLSAGVFGGLLNLSSHPVDVEIGTTAAVFGVYGLLLAALAWQIIHRFFAAQPEPDVELVIRSGRTTTNRDPLHRGEENRDLRCRVPGVQRVQRLHLRV